MSTPGLVVLYRWRLEPGRKERFAEASAVMTRALLERGSLGSRLHRGDDDLRYASAQWPSAEARRAAFAQPWDDAAEIEAASEAVEDSVAEFFDPVLLTPVDDHLR